jgi:hypothetical protein
MAKKKTVVEKYEGLLAKYKLDDDDKAFINERIAITKKKNESAKNGEPTPKEKEKMAEQARIEGLIATAMEQGKAYTPTDLLKVVEGLPADYNTQRLTPRLTAMVADNRLTKVVVKGRSVYSLPAVEDTADEG